MNLWRALFALAALVNLTVGGAMVVSAREVAVQLGVLGPGAPYAIIMCGMMIAVFGVGYAIVSGNPAGNRGIVWIGVIGKLGASALGAWQYAQSLIPQTTFILGMGDAVFAALFLLFLWRGPRPA